MPKQVKGTTTNFTKLVSWDIDLYNSFSDEDGCLICLTPRDRYLLRNALRQMKWDTRWTSEIGTPLPDISSISEDLSFKLSDANCIDLCQAIADCINDDTSPTAQALADYLARNGYEANRDGGQSWNDSGLGILGNPACNFDILFGQSTQLVDYLDEVNKNIIARIEEATQPAEQLADIIGNITGIDETSIDAVFAWISYLQDNIATNYDAEVTPAYKTEVACDLFCLAKEQNCEITPRLMFDYFGERLSSAITVEGLLRDTLGYLVGGIWSGTQIADFMFWAQLGFRSQLGRIVDNTAYIDIDVRMQAYANDPDPDWTILCDCATGWTSTLDFTTSRYGFGFIDGEWVDGVGFKPTNTGDDRRLLADLIIDEATVTQIGWTASITIDQDPQGNATAQYLIRDNGVIQSGSQLYVYPTDTPIGTTNLDFSKIGFSNTVDSIRLFMRPDNDGFTGDGVISQITISGTGTKPSQLP